MAGNIGTSVVYKGLKQALFLRKPLTRLPVPVISTVTAGPRHHDRRNLFTSPVSRVKEISVTETDDQIVIEGKYVTSPREKYLINFPTNATGCKECALCKLGLTVRHTDVLIINQFINSKGKQLPREVTGLCKDQHKRMDYLIVMAEKAGLIDREVERTVVHNNVVLYTPEEWEDPNYKKYYDESVIEEFLYKKRSRHI